MEMRMMKKFLFVSAMLVLVWGFDVQGGQFYVSVKGNDTNPGTLERPFRTIQRAADVMVAGDTCYVREGTYRETVKLGNSGSEGKLIRFIAYPGEKVLLCGTETIYGGWKVYKGKIYQKHVERDFVQLFVDGKMMIEARWPNMRFEDCWDKKSWATAGEGSRYGKMVDPELAKTGIDWTGAIARLNVGAWKTWSRIVGRHNAGSDAFEYDRDLGERLQHKKKWAGFDHYFLSWKLEALDTPTEWFLDATSRTLYLWTPDGKNPASHKVEGKTRDYAFEVSGKEFIEISGIDFFATTFKIEGNYCTVDSCHLLYPTYSRRITESKDVLEPTLMSGSHNKVRNCIAAYSEAPGFTMGGTENRLENCLIHDIGWRGLGSGFGVDMRQSSNSVIRRCTVYNIGGSEGIRLASRGRMIAEYNYVHHGGLVQSDGALFQTGSPNIAGTVIRYNWVHDHIAFNWGGNGIRGDDQTRGLSVHHNVVWNCRYKGIITKGDKNMVYNNTCFDNDEIDILIPRRAEPFKAWAKQWPLLEKQNQNTRTINNCAPVISGLFPGEIRRAGKIEPPFGEVANNYQGKTAKLVAPSNFDFRPREGSPLIDAGQVVSDIAEVTAEKHKGSSPDIGAYEYGDRNYWIPGCKLPKASMPIPPNRARQVKRDAEIMWLGGYGAVSHDVYFGTDRSTVANATSKGKEYKGNQKNNIFEPGPLDACKTYYWRIDAVDKSGVARAGDVWSFTRQRFSSLP